MTIFAVSIYDHRNERMALEFHLDSPLEPGETQPKCLARHTFWRELGYPPKPLDADGCLYGSDGHLVLTCVWSALP